MIIDNWLKQISIDISQMLKVNCELGNLLASINEIEITNKIIRELAILTTNPDLHLNFRMWHAKNESTNGNDIEIVVEISKGEFVLFPCQCKRVFFRNGKSRYDKLWYSTEKHGFQFENLINYAKELKAIPLYMLYNFSKSENFNDSDGVTVCSANFIGNQYYFIDDYPSDLYYEDIHPPALNLASFLSSDNVSEDPYMDYSAKIYSLEELDIIPGWVEINPPIEFSDQRFVRDISRGIESNSRVSTGFIPKFRIMFTQNKFRYRTPNYL